MRDLVARVAMAAAVPVTIVGADVWITGSGIPGPAVLATLLWATCALAGVLILGPRQTPRAVPPVAVADDIRTAA